MQNVFFRHAWFWDVQPSSFAPAVCHHEYVARLNGYFLFLSKPDATHLNWNWLLRCSGAKRLACCHIFLDEREKQSFLQLTGIARSLSDWIWEILWVAKPPKIYIPNSKSLQLLGAAKGIDSNSVWPGTAMHTRASTDRLPRAKASRVETSVCFVSPLVANFAPLPRSSYWPILGIEIKFRERKKKTVGHLLMRLLKSDFCGTQFKGLKNVPMTQFSSTATLRCAQCERSFRNLSFG